MPHAVFISQWATGHEPTPLWDFMPLYSNNQEIHAVDQLFTPRDAFSRLFRNFHIQKLAGVPRRALHCGRKVSQFEQN